MKKLIVMTMLALGASQLFAANMDWSVSRKAWGVQGDYTYTTFQGVDGSAMYAFLATDFDTVSGILSAATSGADVNFSSIAVKDLQTTSSKGASTGTLTSSTALADSVDASVFFVVFDTADVSAATKYLISNVQSGTAYDAASPTHSVPAVWDERSSSSGVTTTWQTFAAVPEPTSGLLLLLGIAGLALRRKQA